MRTVCVTVNALPTAIVAGGLLTVSVTRSAYSIVSCGPAMAQLLVSSISVTTRKTSAHARTLYVPAVAHVGIVRFDVAVSSVSGASGGTDWLPVSARSVTPCWVSSDR